MFGQVGAGVASTQSTSNSISDPSFSASSSCNSSIRRRKTAKFLTKGFWSFAILGGCLAIASFVMHYLDLVPWHSVWQTACIALLWDGGGESFCE